MWEYIRTVEVSEDNAGKWRARILCSNNGTEECFFIKFQSYPALSEIDAAAAGFIAQKNSPAPQPE